LFEFLRTGAAVSGIHIGADESLVSRPLAMGSASLPLGIRLLK